MISPADSNSSLALMTGIVLSAFVSEDGAIVGAATLASTMALDLSLALFSAFFGLWISDFGVYAAVRIAKEKLPADSRSARWINSKLGLSEHNYPKRQEQLALALSRMVPGTRLPAYVSAGLLRMPVATFAGITALSAALWTALVFVAIHLFPLHARSAEEALGIASIAGLGVFALFTVWKLWGPAAWERFAITLKKWRRWEFWPAWLFYPPVALMCGWLAIRFRGLALPTVANPGQRNGGMVGESKIDILRDLMRTSPEFTADAYLLSPGPLAQRMEQLEFLCHRNEIGFPFVLKPDAAQRGAGFRKIRSWREVGAYLSRVQSPVVLQRYVDAPEEAGVFYYRFPSEEQGHIFAITEKVFPHVVGDGIRTLEQLIRADDRAALIADTYLTRFGKQAGEVVPEGEHVRLVEAGNHCQGCIFRDGSELNTEKLRAILDTIALPLAGFFIGRFDIRYISRQHLCNGTGFKIIELNGAASEATNIYDARNSLWAAYKTLYQQWKLVYAIGAANRDRGIRPASVLDVWRDWRQFRSQAEFYPLAD
jgi:membrane protein DedA with SNARE-associated domain